MNPFLKLLQHRTPLGWLQLRHDRGRLLVALAGIAFADVLMFMQLGFQNALYDSNTRLSRSLQADLVLVGPQMRNMQFLSTFSRRRLYQALDVPGVQSASALYSNLITWKNPQTRQERQVQAIGFDPNQPAFNLPEANQNLEAIKLPDRVLFDRTTRGEYEQAIAAFERGQSVTTEVERRTIQIAGLFTLGSSFAADGTLLTSDQTFLRLFPRREAGSISLGLIELQPGANPQQVAAALRSYLPNDVKVLTHAELVRVEEDYWKTQSPIGFIFGMGTTMAFFVGVVIVYQVLSTDVNAHLKEYATFKAMGYNNGYLLGVVFEEAIILAVLGFIPGVGLPLVLYQLAANATALPIFMTLSRVALVLVLTLVMCAMSGAIATRKLQAADPADMF
ncbi:ABC transporter permease DevC [Altericista sp. CCNU0014]|uniref:ABC transporter permease DevC n=1 Tax=Altericista sp. CCNU0014 TaxID=3082949 RepID=UPI00385162C6